MCAAWCPLNAPSAARPRFRGTLTACKAGRGPEDRPLTCPPESKLLGLPSGAPQPKPLQPRPPPATMREIVHIQGGQCGNQIGAKFWEVRPGAGARAGLTPAPGPRAHNAASPRRRWCATSTVWTPPAPTMATATCSWSASTSTSTRPLAVSGRSQGPWEASWARCDRSGGFVGVPGARLGWRGACSGQPGSGGGRPICSSPHRPPCAAFGRGNGFWGLLPYDRGVPGPRQAPSGGDAVQVPPCPRPPPPLPLPLIAPPRHRLLPAFSQAATCPAPS